MQRNKTIYLGSEKAALEGLLDVIGEQLIQAGKLKVSGNSGIHSAVIVYLIREKASELDKGKAE